MNTQIENEYNVGTDDDNNYWVTSRNDLTMIDPFTHTYASAVNFGSDEKAAQLFADNENQREKQLELASELWNVLGTHIQDSHQLTDLVDSICEITYPIRLEVK